eukprot:scaffold74588_cov19-Tisochrysis_lutea.AAC.1
MHACMGLHGCNSAQITVAMWSARNFERPLAWIFKQRHAPKSPHNPWKSCKHTATHDLSF